MAGEFAQGALAAQEVNKQNPFSVIMNRFDEAFARKMKERQAENADLADLKKTFLGLQAKYNYDTELAKIQEEEKRKTGLLEQQTKGVVTEAPEGTMGAFEGTPFGMPGKQYISKGEKKPKTIISPMVDKISKGEDAYYTLGEATNELEANKDRFAQFLGPAKGALRHPIRSYVNKDLQDFLAWKANVQDAFQQYRVVITGAQASDKEIALLAKNRPTEEDTYEVFTKKSKKVREIGNQVLTRYIGNLGKAGYDVSNYEGTLENLNKDLEKLSKDTNGQQQDQMNDPEYQKYLQAIGQ